MPIDNTEIKKALDDFEKDDFLSAKDRIKREVRGAISDYYKDKLELKNDLEPKAEVETETGTEAGTEAGGTEE
jgi:hypothetical protein